VCPASVASRCGHKATPDPPLTHTLPSLLLLLLAFPRACSFCTHLCFHSCSSIKCSWLNYTRRCNGASGRCVCGLWVRVSPSWRLNRCRCKLGRPHETLTNDNWISLANNRPTNHTHTNIHPHTAHPRTQQSWRAQCCIYSREHKREIARDGARRRSQHVAYTQPASVHS
jgi:hypothetical protein